MLHAKEMIMDGGVHCPRSWKWMPLDKKSFYHELFHLFTVAQLHFAVCHLL